MQAAKPSLGGILVLEVGDLIRPLTSLSSVQDAEALLRELGWRLPTAAAAIANQFSTLSDDVDDVVAAADSLFQALSSGVGEVSATFALLDEVTTLVTTLKAIATTASNGIPTEAGLGAHLIPRFLNLLVVEYLREERPPIFALFTALGLIDETETIDSEDPADTWAVPYTRRDVHWERFGDVLFDIEAVVKTAYDLNSNAIEAKLIAALRRAMRAVGIPGGMYEQHPDIATALGQPAGTQELRIPIHKGGQWPTQYFEGGLGISLPKANGVVDGIAFVPYFSGLWALGSGPAANIGGWSFSLTAEPGRIGTITTGTIDVGASAAIVIRANPPNGEPPVQFHSDLIDTTTPLSLRVAAELTRAEPDNEPVRLLGDPNGTRLTMDSFTIRGNLDADTTGLELRAEAELKDLTFFLEVGGGFIGSMVPVGGLEASLSITGAWSSSTGFSVQGSADLAFGLDIPINRSIAGIVTLDAVHLRIGLDPLSKTLEASLTLSAFGSLGPFSAFVDRIGVSSELGFSDSAGGSLGPLELVGPSYHPPSGVGLSMAETDFIRGSGFLTRTGGRYTGALALEIAEVGIQGITIIDTELPNQPDGWAFFASLSLMFPSIPLGFGFTLNGVGGLIAINRGFNPFKLAEGLRTGAVDALLFPDDPLGDANQLISQIDEYFPIKQGNVVIGPIVELGWGTPTILVAQLGFIVSLPEGIVAVMGSVSASLPNPSASLLTLNMDALGVVDIPGGTFSLLASLYDSRLLAKIDLSGDMAMYLRWSRQPYFLLSVGGYHPAFQPENVPSVMQSLRRMRASIEVGSLVDVSIEAYFAITPNTVQFGAALHLQAVLDIGITTFSAVGWFSFDILITFSPFRIAATVSAGVGIFAGNKELLGVELYLHLEGPKPWYAEGLARFKFFGFPVEFEFEVGEKALDETAPVAQLRSETMASITNPNSWRESKPTSGVQSNLTFEDPGDDGDILWLRPDRSLSVVQSIAPLNKDIEIFGQAIPLPSDRRLNITGVGINNEPFPYDTVTEWFAPAQYEKLKRKEKLARASFEEMVGGVSFGDASIDASNEEGHWVSVSTSYEEIVDQEGNPHPVIVEGVEGSLANSVGIGAAAKTKPLAAHGEGTFDVMPTTYTIISTVDGMVAEWVFEQTGVNPAALTQGEALQTLAQIAVSSARNLAVVPAATVME
ncbi:MAG: DUF6603 domain-containing protein [Myxococcota bacterium]